MAQLEPKDVVLRAYEAANQAKWSAANRYLSPEARESTKADTMRARKAVQQIRLGLRALPKEQRKGFRAFARVMEEILDPPHAFAWKGDIGKGSIRALRITRQVIRAEEATVSFRIEWRDGSIDRESAHLVRFGKEWRLSHGSGAGRFPVRSKSDA